MKDEWRDDSLLDVVYRLSNDFSRFALAVYTMMTIIHTIVLRGPSIDSIRFMKFCNSSPNGCFLEATLYRPDSICTKSMS